MFGIAAHDSEGMASYMMVCKGIDSWSKADSEFSAEVMYRTDEFRVFGAKVALEVADAGGAHVLHRASADSQSCDPEVVSRRGRRRQGDNGEL